MPKTFAPRLGSLPEYAFPRLRALLADHKPAPNLIDFSIGEPKHAPPEFVREILTENFADFSRYPPVDGTESYRAAIRDWLTRRYALPEGYAEKSLEILPLSGTREGLFMSVVATTPEPKGDVRPAIALPNPFYQCYAAASVTAGAEPIYLSATKETNFLPSLDLPEPLLNRLSAFFVCSPSNPEGAIAPISYWEKLLKLAEKHDFYVFADECYAEIYRNAPPPGVLSALSKTGADPNRVLAFHSLSKRSNLAGLRSGFVAGGAGPIGAVKKLKAYAGAPQPLPITAASEAVWRDEAHVEESRKLYQQKFAIADSLFTNLPSYRSVEAGFFLWIPVQDGVEAAVSLWRDFGLKTLPGAYLSRVDHEGVDPGQNYVRAALVDAPDRVEEGLTRLKTYLERATG